MSLTIIAEIAKSHNGSLPNAYALIDEAVASGANWVKFQAYGLNDLNTKHPNYQRYKEAYLSLDQLTELKSYCDVRHTRFYCSCFTLDLLPYLSKFTNTIKIPSTFLSYESFVNLAIELFPEIHISTGMHDFAVAVKYLDKYADYAYKKKKIFIPYHCVSMYPTMPNYARIIRIKHLVSRYGDVGYSDHCIGNQAAMLAYHYGAKYLEKHFTANNANQPWCWTEMELKRFLLQLEHEASVIADSLITETELQNYRYYKDEYQGLARCHLNVVTS